MAVTVTVFTGSVTDPVNVTKLFVLGGCSFAVLGSILARKTISTLKHYKATLLATMFFLLASISALINSEAPFVQSLYGVYGRNNGFVLYILLTVLFVSTLSITKVTSFKALLNGLLVAGVVNLLYAFWVIVFGDFIPWNNIYGNLLGTLGNPNFIGSFFGMFSGLLASALFSPGMSLLSRSMYLALLAMTFFGVLETNAVQGKVLFIASVGIVFYYWLRSRFDGALVPIVYLGFSFSAIVVGALGTLQIGPLSRLLYKETVSLRGEYWAAGWQTGVSNPIFGVGFDSFGDWYRRSRRESALTLPGLDTVTNAAHNVYLDMFAFGGLPLFLSYIVLSLITIVSIIRVSLRMKHFENSFVVLVSVWVCYQLQSLISINQIGLAIWGWVFSGALIAYERITRVPKSQSPPSTRDRKNQESDILISAGLKAGVLSIVGLLAAAPPLSADMKWREAQVSQDANRVIETLNASYLNPLTSFKIVSVVGVLETNGFSEQAHEYALAAVKFNPESFDSWRSLTLLSKSTEAEKTTAYKKMQILDPLNRTIKVGSK